MTGPATVAEAAEALELTKQQVLNRIHRKKIPAKKKGWFWLIPRAFINQHSKKAK